MPNEIENAAVNNKRRLWPSLARDKNDSEVARNVPATHIEQATKVYIFSGAITLLILDFDSAFRSWLPRGMAIMLETTIKGRPRDITF